MLRKWFTLALTMVSVGALAVGMSFAADEEGPVHQIMEKVNKHSNAIKKATRSKVAFQKTKQADIVKNTKELIELSKETKKYAKEAAAKAKGEKDGEKKWNELSDAFTAELEKFLATAEKPGLQFEQAKSAWTTAGKSCAGCHTIFRVDEDSSF
jgi:cytochrome c556